MGNSTTERMRLRTSTSSSSLKPGRCNVIWSRQQVRILKKLYMGLWPGALTYAEAATPASIVGSIVLASKVSLLLLVPTAQAQNLNQMCEKYRTLSNKTKHGGALWSPGAIDRPPSVWENHDSKSLQAPSPGSILRIEPLII